MRFAYYDDLDPHCLDKGYVNFDGRAYGKLWALCRESGQIVVADIHTHPGRARQSWTDQQNPMIAQKGHVALLLPNFALHRNRLDELGVYEYLGSYHWNEYAGEAAASYFYIGFWG
jgi:hypothetical protein